MNTPAPQQDSPQLLDYLKAIPQYLLPGHLVSRLTYLFTRITSPAIKNPFTLWFIKHFHVDMSLAIEEDPQAYAHFNAFFTRALKPELRPIVSDANAICSPVDGVVSQFGKIKQGTLIQAKGHHYSVEDLLGGSRERAKSFSDGDFITIYLSPSDYHRIHIPYTGKLREMVHIPGRLFSVSLATAKVIPNLFARNERVASLFDTSLGSLAVVKVGAVNVGSIETVWAGEVTPPAGRTIRQWSYPETGNEAVLLEKGAELGRFNMGSTVILLFEQGKIRWPEQLIPGTRVVMGSLLAEQKVAVD